MKIKKKHIISGFFAVLVVAFVTYAFLPSPILVDVGIVERGAMQVTIDEEGQTRVRNRYTIAAPATGRLTRLVLKEGDAVEEGTEVADLRPAPLGTREVAEAQARVESTKARLREAEAQAAQAGVAREEARHAYERAEELAKVGGISFEAREQAERNSTIGQRALEAAQFRVQATASEVDVARSALLALQAGRGGAETTMAVRSPVRGRVLRVFEESERVILAGAPILEIGDPSDLEIRIDVLSEDAVRIQPGNTVMIEDWGGEVPLRAVVRLIEPSAFTKLSALGVEEQRVNVIADLPDAPPALGDAYRVEGRIVIWET